MGVIGCRWVRAQRAIRQVIANQILDDQPPEVWATAQRLAASGLEREQAMGQLGMVFAATMRDLLADERSFDPEAYAAALARLPLPEAPVVQQALLGIAGAEPGIALDAWRVGVADDRYCLRVVPDGEGHQIVVGVFAVAAGTEPRVLDLLDEADPIAIARYVADLERPPAPV